MVRAHSESIAWGITNARLDITDLWFEVIVPDGDYETVDEAPPVGRTRCSKTPSRCRISFPRDPETPALAGDRGEGRRLPVDLHHRSNRRVVFRFNS